MKVDGSVVKLARRSWLRAQVQTCFILSPEPYLTKYHFCGIFCFMGYSIQLGYSTATVGESLAEGDFELAVVEPFEGGSELPIEPVAKVVYEELYEPMPEAEEGLEPTTTTLPPQITDDGRMEAGVTITTNYTKRIAELTCSGLRDLDQKVASEGAALLLELVARLTPEEPNDNYWEPTDGNIAKMASVLLGWVFEHPDATFRSIG